ncbi:MAG TPA: SDR family oxidoreductase [Gaiellaceae bacterium]|nr:SDR family oxidoreductase [Gaiellaceae bacterium]
MADRMDGQVALVTGGGRGIGARIARELADAGMKVAVSARTPEQVEEIAGEIDGLGVVADVSRREDVERMVAEVEQELGPVDLLVANAGVAHWGDEAWTDDPDEWWHVFEINVLGAFLAWRTVIPGMIERGAGRIVNTGSGSGYLPGQRTSAYGASKAALYRLGENLALQLEPYGIAVFTFSPGLVKTEMTERFPDDMPWTPPELAPRLVRVLASGRADKLRGRYIHAEHDDIEDLIQRADEIVENDLNAIRLQR